MVIFKERLIWDVFRLEISSLVFAPRLFSFSIKEIFTRILSYF